MLKKTLKILVKLFPWIAVNSFSYDAAKNTNIIMVNPQQIKRTLWYRFDNNIYNNIGVTCSGIWDFCNSQIDTRPAVKALKEHFLYEVPWEDTSYYHLRLSGRYGEFKTEETIKSYLHEIDKLYYQIKKEGYLYNYPGYEYNNYSQNEIGIAISRYGDLLFCHDGQHRLTIAQLIGINEIPVRVIVRHKLWVKKKSEAISNKKRSNSGLSYLLDHPDIIMHN